MRGVDQQNLSSSQQNILANSIRLARQKFARGEQVIKNEIYSKDADQHSFVFSKDKKESSAALAIKTLHTRISELEAFNASLAKDLSQTKRDNNLLKIQLQSLRREYQSKMTEFKQQFGSVEKSLKEKDIQLTQYIQRLRTQQVRWNERIKQKQEKLGQCEGVKQNLQKKVKDLNKRVDNNQKLIVQMIKELEQKQKSGNGSGTRMQQSIKYSKQIEQKQSDTFPIIVDEPENSQILQSISKRKKSKGSMQVKQRNMKTQQALNELQQKNKQLYLMLRTSQRKLKQEQKSKNQLREKFYSLKDLTDSMIEQINKLPSSLATRFKCLIVKVTKIERHNLESLTSYSCLTRNRLYSKSSRRSSNSPGSKNKEKFLKMQDLNLSDHNMSETRSHSKRKKQISMLDSKSKSKRERENLSAQKMEERQISKKIRKQRKEMCEIYRKTQEEKDPEKGQKLKNQLEKKMAENVQLQEELKNYKRSRL